MEDVEPQVNKMEAVAPWCSIDTSSGNLTVVLEPYNCFDAEAYADELVLDEPVEFKDDQRSKFSLHPPRLLAQLTESNGGEQLFITIHSAALLLMLACS